MQERVKNAFSGYMMIIAVPLFILIGLILAALFMDTGLSVIGIIIALIGIFCAGGFIIVDPNEAKALVLFGKYKGSVKTDGFQWVNPLYRKMDVSLRAHSLNGEKIKVNDKNGNPIIISVVGVWRVKDTAKALFDVENYTQFVNAQSEAAIRSLAGKYPYEHFDLNEPETITLRTEADTVNKVLEEELTKRLERAGIEIVEARINHLAYSEEIASAMLQRQQASAIVAARKEIVDGAVSIVEMALQKLSEKQIVQLDEERKAAMVSNLLVVLTSDKQTQPVINTGTLYN